MIKSFLYAIIVSLLISVPIAADTEGWQGTHPYDSQERILRGYSHKNNNRTWGYSEINRFYVSHYRTYTHVLHPYYRNAQGLKYGRIPDNQFNYPYGNIGRSVISLNKYYK